MRWPQAAPLVRVGEPMAGRTYRRRPQVEARFVDIELAERRLALLASGVLLLLTVAVVVMAIVCAARGTAWPLATAAGGLVTVTGRLFRR
jgi:hypothetical protein